MALTGFAVDCFQSAVKLLAKAGGVAVASERVSPINVSLQQSVVRTLEKPLQFVSTSPYFQEKGTLRYLSQGMPVRDGLAWVRQHFVPVVAAQALSLRACSAHTNHLIVAHSVQEVICRMNLGELIQFKHLHKDVITYDPSLLSEYMGSVQGRRKVPEGLLFRKVILFQ